MYKCEWIKLNGVYVVELEAIRSRVKRAEARISWSHKLVTGPWKFGRPIIMDGFLKVARPKFAKIINWTRFAVNKMHAAGLFHAPPEQSRNIYLTAVTRQIATKFYTSRPRDFPYVSLIKQSRLYFVPPDPYSVPFPAQRSCPIFQPKFPRRWAPSPGWSRRRTI